MSLNYKDCGVDIDKGDLFVERISKLVKSTYNQNVVSGVGGFCALYAQDEERYLASSTDGVGTKIKLAIELGIHETIGIDLVAMCVNDLICSGARPLFFLDYFASSNLNLEVSESVLKGIVEGCIQSQMVLIGGETAEMPGMYQEGDYDLAGFSVGEVFKSNLIDGKKLSDGDSLVGIASSGFHSNGYSLIRKILELKNVNLELKKACLKPTKIYVKSILGLLATHFNEVKGIANITGSGFLNIPRINNNFDYFVNETFKMPTFMNEVCNLSELSEMELHKTFNMGVGMVIATNNPNSVIKKLTELGESASLIGFVKNGSGKIIFKNQEL